MTSHRIAPLPPTHRLSPRPSPRLETRRPRPRHSLALAAVWTVTRAGMLALLAVDRLGDSGVAGEVHTLYRGWYEQLVHGAFPVDDVTWQYPPGAALVFLSPGALPWLTYFQAFVALVLVADAAVTAALARAGTGGAWLWICGLPLLLNLPLARYDVPVTAVAVLALLAMRERPRLSGALAGLGAMIKVWPLLTVLGAPRGRTTRAVWLSAAASAGALLTVLALGFSDTLGFLRQQEARGVQIESLGGTVLQLARRAGWSGEVRFQYGAFEFAGPYVSTVAELSLALTVAALGWLLLWRVRARRWNPATPLDAAFAAVLLFTVTSRVISPQYLVWLLGLAAVCLTSRHTSQRAIALLMVPAAGISSLAYPLLYDDVVEGSALGCALMVVRNGLLLTAAVLACRRLWKATV
ncbi:glycosyltransferase 87 family protein [Streptomyces sp. NPDC051018]|uniref:glycosyltransferase 87 family protein n=1 Tax=Streptomyces sp. NPDC051018 TaxID=3365639 RepID=UPI0037A16BDF